jgi:hypothetical protein
MRTLSDPAPLDDEAIAAIELAIQNVWKIFESRNPYPNWNSDPALKKELAQNLMSLADNGVRTPEDLTDQALKMFSFWQS